MGKARQTMLMTAQEHRACAMPALRAVPLLLLVALAAANVPAASAWRVTVGVPEQVPVCVYRDDPPLLFKVDAAKPCGPPFVRIEVEDGSVTVTVCEGSGLTGDCRSHRVTCSEFPTRYVLCFTANGP